VRRPDGMIALTMHIMRNVVVALGRMCGGVDVRTELVDRRVRLIILAGWVARMLSRGSRKEGEERRQKKLCYLT
jgi:hypothetical protein